jgi:hypothetical protein
VTTLHEQAEQCRAFADRVEQLAFEFWSEVEFEGAAEPVLRMALENLRRAAEDLRHGSDELAGRA